MLVCHITTVHPGDDARIFHRMARGLSGRGVRVVLVAPWDSGSDPQVAMSPWNRRIHEAGRVRRLGLALRAALAEPADVYHFHDPELIPVGFTLKALRPSRAVVYDVHEDYPAMMLEKYWLPVWSRPVAARAIRALQLATGLLLDAIVTADPGVENDFRSIAPGRTLVYYNFPSPSLFTAPPPATGTPRADLVYIGGLSRRAGTFVLLDALTELASQGVRPSLRLAGYADGEAGWRALRAGIEERGLADAVQVAGRLPHAAVPGWIQSGRIGLVPLQPIAKFMNNIPSKMFEYWACGLPVIASDLPPARQFLSDGVNGLFFDPSSPKDLARVIRYLLDRPAAAESMGRAGRQLVEEKWNNDHQVDGLIRLYERIIR